MGSGAARRVLLQKSGAEMPSLPELNVRVGYSRFANLIIIMDFLDDDYYNNGNWRRYC